MLERDWAGLQDGPDHVLPPTNKQQTNKQANNINNKQHQHTLAITTERFPPPPRMAEEDFKVEQRVAEFCFSTLQAIEKGKIDGTTLTLLNLVWREVTKPAKQVLNITKCAVLTDRTRGGGGCWKTLRERHLTKRSLYEPLSPTRKQFWQNSWAAGVRQKHNTTWNWTRTVLMWQESAAASLLPCKNCYKLKAKQQQTTANNNKQQARGSSPENAEAHFATLVHVWVEANRAIASRHEAHTGRVQWVVGRKAKIEVEESILVRRSLWTSHQRMHLCESHR